MIHSPYEYENCGVIDEMTCVINAILCTLSDHALNIRVFREKIYMQHPILHEKLRSLNFIGLLLRLDSLGYLKFEFDTTTVAFTVKSCDTNTATKKPKPAVQ